MKNIKNSSILLLGITISTQLSAKESKLEALAHSNAVESCATLTNKSVDDLGVSAEYKGVLRQQWRQIVGSMCLNGITAARNAKSEDSLNDYWFGMKQKYFEANAGVLATPLDPAWEISKKYFNALNPDAANRKIEQKKKASEDKAKRDAAFDAEIGFPHLPQGYSEDQFNTAYRYFINTKKTKGGLSIKETCEKAIKKNNFLSNYSILQMITAHGYDEQAVVICQNVMVYNVSLGKYGENPQEIIISSTQGELSEFSYPGNNYMAIVARWADSNAK
ncbi:TPA: hypothetical protein PXM28_001459 [Yersinia enterocolitica]|nr:hypothetical protein [Yersinia enterocolitica]